MAATNGDAGASTSNGNGAWSDEHASVLNFIGGQSIHNAPPSKVADYVKARGGHTVITKVLIANNGIAALKCIRSIRKWNYETFGDERAIQFTVMATPEDLKVNADYIRMADQYVEVPGGSNNNNYANVDVIVDVAERAGVHAVWAGWGHASENPRLPESLHALKNRIVFIGPPGSAMRSLGDKISSTIVAQHAKVPCMAWSGTGITDTQMSAEGFVEVPEDAYLKACVRSASEGLERANTIGYPVMIKASEGGGGKGIRKVESEQAFAQAFKAVESEVPGSPIFIMKLAGSARHLEVQLLADQYGNAVSLFGRDCSVQRRHQKIIEEAPVTIAKPDTFEKMEKSAVRLAKLVGYVSAGTVEFLHSPAEDAFYFLELNPRLQVEHPTTEMVSGVNLPAAQLQIAMGLPLHMIRDIRTLYGTSPHDSTKIDFEFTSPSAIATQRKPSPKGHVVAVRITAENPDAGFKPSSGTLQELNFRSSTNVWGYFSVAAAGGLHEFADSQFGHIFAYGADRSESRKNMVVALKELSIRGDFRHTVEYLIKLLEFKAFEENTITTGWLDSLISERLTAERPDQTLAIICGAVTKAQLLFNECVKEFKTVLQKGQVPPKETLKTVFSIDFINEGIKYAATVARSSPNQWTLYLNGGKISVGARPLADGGLLVLLDGKSHAVYYAEEVGTLRVSIDNKTCLIEQESDPTQLRSPSPGKLVRFLVESGDHVKAGEAYAEIEVMKMIMSLIATEDGVPQFVKQAGAALEAGDILGILTLDDPSKVQHAKPFSGQLPAMGLPNPVGSKPHQRFAYHKSIVQDILDGYDNQSQMQNTLKELITVLRDPELPYSEALAVLSTLSGRLPAKLEASIRATLDAAHAKGAEFPSAKIHRSMENYVAENLRQNEVSAFRTTTAALADIVQRYMHGLKGHEWSTLAGFMRSFYETEQIFSGKDADVALELRDQYRDDLDKVAVLVLSHSKAASKGNLINAILDIVIENTSLSAVEAVFAEVLQSLADLDSKSTQKVALKAREVLIRTQLPSLQERTVQMEQILKTSVRSSRYGESTPNNRLPDAEQLKELIDSSYTVYDVLPAFFKHEDDWLSLAALEVYIRRAYKAYNVTGIDYQEEDLADGEPLALTWSFRHQQTLSPPPTPRTPALALSGKGKAASFADLSFALENAVQTAEPVRFGAMFSARSLQELERDLPNVLKLIPNADAGDRAGAERKNVVNAALLLSKADDTKSDSEWYETFSEITTKYSAELDKRSMRRVTFLICREGSYPSYFTMRKSETKWQELSQIRNIEPALAYQLELSRLSNFNITPCFIENRQIHVYYAVGKENPADCRFFVRGLVRPGRLRGTMRTSDYLISETDRLVSDILNALEVASANYRSADVNSIFINFVYSLRIDFDEIQQALAGFIDRHGKRLWRLRVTSSEIRFVLEDEQGHVQPIRAIIENVSGFVVKYEAYREVKGEKGQTILKSIGQQGSKHLQPVNQPYPTKEWLQPKRYKAHVVGTTYVYDFPDLFRQALRRAWKAATDANPSGPQPPKDPLKSVELVLDEFGQPHEVPRAPGSNTIGMVGWIYTMYTPECPAGRRVVVLSNDITFKIGSFGPEEDFFFYKCTQLARQLGIPRIYLSANSGARLGIADEVVDLFNVGWQENDSPEKGFSYFYLTPANYALLNSKGENSVLTQKIQEGEETRYMITDIVGLQEGLGVESLKGSGLIAGETSRAYEDIFTITLVTCRSVGIGAYLVRLGQRAVQVEGQPIILTGANALNKVLGREVYSSNLQLGGTQIMYKNGVSHLTAANDLEGVLTIVNWLSYVPSARGLSLPLLPSADPVDRPIGYTPPKGPYDPRWFIAGKPDEADPSRFISGFFDKGSFQETLSGWAQTVVTGRARLGGIPMGVIAVETRTIERVVPADPANPNSQEQRIMEAGQVWYPNSAFKTAQAIFDFNREELPLIIFANWRGFSGGQQDMFDEVLKRGSLIVDGLSAYKAPAFVYIVPNGELRGGAWVVLDPSINSNGMMEMYADTTSRAGVLEPEGIVEIKFRKAKVLQMMERLDDRYRSLKASSTNASLPAEEAAKAKAELAAREKLLMPTYSAIALQFADLHDRANRMKAKGTIREALEWSSARPYFYWRLRRRLAEETVIKQLVRADSTLSRAEGLSILRGIVDADEPDQSAARTLEKEQASTVEARIAEVRRRKVEQDVAALAQTDRAALLEGFKKAFGNDQEVQSILARLA